MPKTSGNSRNQRNNPYQLDELFIKFHRSPAGIAWRWRTELLVLAALAVQADAFWRFDTWTNFTWTLVVLAVFVGLVAGVPHPRRFITRRFWCVLSRHRIQKLCYEARLHTRSGRLPVILWIRPTKVGERTWVLCRAGICAEDFEAHTGELRAACYAREARVTRNRRWSQLVTIDIIRRDTLAASHIITSPLERLCAVYADRFDPADLHDEPGPEDPFLDHEPGPLALDSEPGTAVPDDKPGADVPLPWPQEATTSS